MRCERAVPRALAAMGGLGLKLPCVGDSPLLIPEEDLGGKSNGLLGLLAGAIRNRGRVCDQHILLDGGRNDRGPSKSVSRSRHRRSGGPFFHDADPSLGRPRLGLQLGAS